jgi:hypothetical protein
MADKVTIVNRALSLLGAEPITDLDENTQEADIANRFYDESRVSVLSEVLWNFAAKRKTLTQVVVTPEFVVDQMTYVYQIPSDVVRIFGVNSNYVTWRLEQEYIYADTSELGIIYVFDQTDTTKFSSSFTDAFADKLAADMAYSINNSTTSTRELLEKYEGVSLPKATAENSQVGTPPQVDDNLWSYSRFGFSPVNRTGARIA